MFSLRYCIITLSGDISSELPFEITGKSGQTIEGIVADAKIDLLEFAVECIKLLRGQELVGHGEQQIILFPDVAGIKERQYPQDY